ncbi:hypothetical protein CMUS01_13744 [Colletotrichum musicola]|uniref:Uncharacterized protein n=1 Tax=Colletotrichum musicola TaxID=2175873 RepID=A0A8H6JAH8_9PEZI|nr:hypothetical protein CMUS01_13744 [Colletotrichum musicola]
MQYENSLESHSPQPTFRLRSPAVDFIENRLPQYHPAFDSRNVRFDNSQDRFVAQLTTRTNILTPQSTSSAMTIPVVSGIPSSPQRLPRPPPGVVNDMAFWDEILPLAMEALKHEPVPSGLKDAKWGIRHLSTWPDVQAKLEMAQREYDFHHGQPHVGKFRRGLRKVLDNHAVTLQQGTRLVPELDIAKPVVGAIKVVLDAYRQVAEVREEVTTSFDDLPEVFEKLDFYISAYPKDQNIITASKNLVRAIFIAVENAVAFYISPQAKRAGVAILSGPQYQKNLLQSLNDIKTCCKTLKSQASMSFTHLMANDNSQIMQDTGLIQHALGSMFQHVQMNNVGTMMYMAHVLNEYVPRTSGAVHSRSPIPRTPSPSPQHQLLEAPPVWYPADIWRCLRNPKIDDEDLQHVAEHTELLLHEDRGRTHQVLATRHFRGWIGVRGSARLLVHGDFRPPPLEISPLSVVCALLTHTFRSSPGFIGLVFFCGRHLAWDEHRGGSAMIGSLIAQLLRQFSFAAVQPDPWISLQDLEGGDVEVLCHVFSLLVRQLPSNTIVVCFIDGICLYETEDYLSGMDVVVMSLLNLVEQSAPDRASFKLLITSPLPTLEVRKVFDPEPDALLHMQTLPLLGDGAGLASFQDRLASNMSFGTE